MCIANQDIYSNLYLLYKFLKPVFVFSRKHIISLQMICQYFENLKKQKERNCLPSLNNQCQEYILKIETHDFFFQLNRKINKAISLVSYLKKKTDKSYFPLIYYFSQKNKSPDDKTIYIPSFLFFLHVLPVNTNIISLKTDVLPVNIKKPTLHHFDETVFLRPQVSTPPIQFYFMYIYFMNIHHTLLLR